MPVRIPGGARVAESAAASGARSRTHGAHARSAARAGRRPRRTAGADAGRPGRRPLRHRHPEADQPRGAGAHPALRRASRLAPGGGANAAANVARARRPAAAGRRASATTTPASELLRRLRARAASRPRASVVAPRLPHADQDADPRRRPAPHQAADRALRRRGAQRARRRRSASDRSSAASRGSAGGARVAILSDYGYGAVDPGARAGGCAPRSAPAATVLCDSRFRLGDFRGLDGATPNEEEAEALLGAPLDDGAGAIDARRRGAARAARRALPARHPRQPRHGAVRRRRRARTCRSTAPTRWPTSPAPATP